MKLGLHLDKHSEVFSPGEHLYRIDSLGTTDRLHRTSSKVPRGKPYVHTDRATPLEPG